MSFKERIYRRSKPTLYRQQEQEALIESHLIGLCLPGMWKPSGNITMQIQKNYGAYQSVNKFGNRVFMHGKELFSPKGAARYFSSAEAQKSFAYADFGDAAKRKIRAILSPESLNDRLSKYMRPDDPVEYFKYFLNVLQKEFPRLILPQLPEPTPEKVPLLEMEILRAMEAQGVDFSSYLQKGRFLDEASIASKKQKIKAFSLERMENAFHSLQQDGDGRGG